MRLIVSALAVVLSACATTTVEGIRSSGAVVVASSGRPVSELGGCIAHAFDAAGHIPRNSASVVRPYGDVTEVIAPFDYGTIGALAELKPAADGVRITAYVTPGILIGRGVAVEEARAAVLGCV